VAINAVSPGGGLFSEVDASLEVCGTRTTGDGGVEDLVCRFQVAGKLIRRHVQRLGAGVEAAGGRIDGQHAC
jgi:hypothetical protein